MADDTVLPLTQETLAAIQKDAAGTSFIALTETSLTPLPFNDPYPFLPMEYQPGEWAETVSPLSQQAIEAAKKNLLYGGSYRQGKSASDEIRRALAWRSAFDARFSSAPPKTLKVSLIEYEDDP